LYIEIHEESRLFKEDVFATKNKQAEKLKQDILEKERQLKAALEKEQQEKEKKKAEKKQKADDDNRKKKD